MGIASVGSSTNRICAFEGSPKQASVRGDYAEVLVQERLKILLRLILIHGEAGGRMRGGTGSPARSMDGQGTWRGRWKRGFLET